MSVDEHPHAPNYTLTGGSSVDFHATLGVLAAYGIVVASCFMAKGGFWAISLDDDSRLPRQLPDHIGVVPHGEMDFSWEYMLAEMPYLEQETTHES